MNAIWFSYSAGADNPLNADEPLASPYTITYHVGRFLCRQAHRRGWRFEYRNLDDRRPADIKAGDIVIGHHWLGEKTDAGWTGGFMETAFNSDASYIFLLQPFTNCMFDDPSAIRTMQLAMARCDHLFLICGRYWFDAMQVGPYAMFANKATRVDMAVNQRVHAFHKRKWGPKGDRTLLAIGANSPAKGLDAVADIAMITGLRLIYYGNAPDSVFQHVPNLIHRGPRLFTPDEIQWVCDRADFFLSMGRCDANPTTLLETASWGLIPFCTPQSGYYPLEPFVALYHDRPYENWRTLEEYVNMEEYDLRRESDRLRACVAEQHNWDRFCETIWAVVEEKCGL